MGQQQPGCYAVTPRAGGDEVTKKVDEVQDVSPLNPAVQDAEWQKRYEERREERKRS